MNTRWRILGRLTTTSPMHVGSGDVTTHDRIRDNDNDHCDVQAVVKDCRGKPCIPGTALKGVLRAWAEKMLPARHRKLDRIFGARDIEADDTESGWAEFCAALVDEPGGGDLNRFEKHVPYWCSESLTGILSHVCIDRETGTASHNKLFYEEFVAEGVSFHVEIDATRLQPEEIALLLAILDQGAKHDTHPYQFGANGVDGWGRVTWELVELKQLDSDTPSFALGSDQAGFDCCTKDVTIETASLDDLKVPDHISTTLMLACEGPFLVNDASRAKRDDMTDEEKKQHTNFTPLRRANGDIWLPASSFRGALRERAEFLLRSFDPNATGDPNQQLGDGPIERVFGKTSQASRLIIQEFGQVGQRNEGRQDFVAIDRFIGGAADGAKFDARCADSPQFQTKLTLDLTGLKPEDVALLGLALRDVCQGSVPLGWGSSKGYGQVEGLLDSPSAVGLPDDWNVPDSLAKEELDEFAKAWLGKQLQKLADPERPNASGKPEPSLAALAEQPAEVPALQGTLKVAKSKKGAIIYTLAFEKEVKGKKKAKSLPVQDQSQIASDLQGQETDGIAVDFVMDGNKATCIRRQGEPWETATVASEVGRDRFANPYSFLRMKDRNKFTGELADAAPVGHKRFMAGRYSGTIRVKLTAKTPLLICDDDDKNIDESENGHKTYDIRLKDGKPDLASSSVRGMLRSAFEAITNSRFGVFPGHPAKTDKPAERNGRRLGFRLPAQRGLNTVPVRVVASPASATGLAVEFLPGTSGVRPDGTVAPGDPVFAAWCGMYGGWTPKGLAGLGHRAHVWAYLTPWHYRRQLRNGRVIEFDFWNVEELRSGATKPTAAPANTALRAAFGRAEPATWGTPDWHHGHLCISLRNMQGKHDERFFFTAGTYAPIPLDESHVHQWRQLIEDYQVQHERELENGSVRPPVLSAPNVYSRHISSAPPNLSLTERELQADDLCYAEVAGSGGSWTVKALYPVIISRNLYNKSPLDCLPEKLRPAASPDELSPADRVFGWVNQDEDAASGQQKAAYRSHIRLGPVSCTTDAANAIEEFDPPKTLAILGQPKPQQGRFYLGDSQGKAQAGGLSKEKAGYNGSTRIRGPKVYPHHAQGIDEHNACSDDPSNQNRSVKGWVTPDTVFEFDLHVTNLSAMELGAVVWLFSLPDDQFLRLGLGKPLGFGSVRAEIDNDETAVADGAAWIESLLQWDAKPSTAQLSALVDEFTCAINAANPQLLDSFRKAAAGFDELAIHYPRLPDQGPSQGEHFQWFVENERGSRHHALPDLFSEDVSLPANPE